MDDGWVEWKGGACPVAGATKVKIKVRDAGGEIWERGGSDEAAWFDTLNWWTGAVSNRIVAYRVVEPLS